MCVLSPDLADSMYLLVWSGQKTPFRYDLLSDVSLSLLNSNICQFWFAATYSRWGGRPKLNLPALPGGVTFSAHTHVFYLDQGLGLRGQAALSIENVIKP
jgi:hypothetical protein